MNVWKIAPGRNAAYWKKYGPHRFTSINWLNSYDLTHLTKQQVHELLIKHDEGASQSARRIWEFVNQIQVGDVIVANDGLSKVVAVGVVTSDYLPPNARRNPNRYEDYQKHVRLVDWKITLPVDLNRKVFDQPTLQLLESSEFEAVSRGYRKAYPDLTPILNELFDSTRELSDENADINEEYQPLGLDSREYAMKQIAMRRGQKRFRDSLLTKYGRRCAVTGCNLVAVLEAAHIQPYRGEQDNKPSNGLLLRSDIHTLFDLNLLGVNPETLSIELNPELVSHNEYQNLHKKKLRLRSSSKPSKAALKLRYKEFQKAMNR